MTSEQALREALTRLREIEFLPELLVVPGAEIFRRHSDIISTYTKAFSQKKRAPAPIRFLYLDRPNFNASAFERAGHHFISMNWGTVIIIYDLFFRILASPSTLPNVGDPTEEISNPKYDRLLVDARHLPSSDDNPFGLTVTPNNKVRYAYAMYLTQIALDFLFVHEHQHIAGGHLTLLRKGNDSSISEIESDAWAGDLLMRHILELEADAAAANFSLGITLDLLGNNWRVPLGAEQCLSSEESRTTAWLFAVLVIFIVMEEAVERSNSKMTHPSPFFRIWLAVSVFGYRMTLFDKPGKLVGLASRSMHDVDIAINAISHRPQPKKFVLDHLSSSVEEHKILLKSRWLEMSSHLKILAKDNGVFCAPEPLINFFGEG